MDICTACQLPVDDPAHHFPCTSGRKCPFCSAVFSRPDGARRHAKTCPQRGSRTLHQGKRGRKTRSCDHCSRLKVHCNARSPCERCVSRKLDCTYSRTATNRHPAAPYEESPAARGSSSRASIPKSFLLNFTDERQDFITECAVGEEPDGALLGPTSVTATPSPAPSDTCLDCINPTLLLPFDESQSYLESLEFERLYGTEEQDLLGAFVDQSRRLKGDLLAARLHQLEREITENITSNPSYRGPPFNPVAFRQFFTVSNVQSFAMIFCRKRHYQYPLIHWPTFHLEEASLPLLMVVALTGATYSYRAGQGLENVTEARKLYPLADAFVFERLKTFLRDTSPFPEANQAEGVSLCQAGLLMYGLETLSISDSGIYRVAVTERLPAIVTALRRLLLVGTRHSPLGDEDWQLFVYRERVIRLVTWTFAVDGLATLCCNNPPIFSMLEMSGSLPCNPALWDADSENEFGLLRRENNAPSLSLKDIMPRLLDGSSKDLDADLDSLSPFDLHIVICALQPIIFNSHVTMALPQQSINLLQALSRWKHLWERALERTSPHYRQYLGMAKNIPAIEHLSRRIVQVATGPRAGSSRYLERVPSYGAKELHSFMQDFMLDV
ncbi:hypothetical protein PspLS_09275 [Pyricularia sp. CBS 133598]|nr:hypothetical protein PspLS_09275 [Pyricularia sp. CBS 133598]